MTMYASREKFQNLSIKIGIVFSKFGLSPNQWTMISIIPVLIAVYFLYYQDFITAAFLFIVSSFIDLIDGSVARVTGRVSRLGAYLDTVVDRYVEGIIIIGLVFVPLPPFLIDAKVWLMMFFFGGIMTTYVKAAAKEKELISRELKGGLLERAERLIILFVGILLASVDMMFLTYVLVLLAILTNISAIQRLYKAISFSSE
ncbi:MAG: CDP-alcohol phosphatidyltransferase family protein [Deltaproteobacteria bacterium]|nr:CDP-alcohol phosphatidyltransferase family protein [Deltaproteobacteria bacterium]